MNRFFQHPFLNRFLDSLAVLIGVSTITFLIVRLSVTINSVKPWFFVFLLALSIFSLSVKSIRAKFYALGIVSIVCLLFTPAWIIFPSIKEAGSNFFEVSWRVFLFPLIWGVLLVLYGIRSFLSREKILLGVVGFLSLLILSGFFFSKLPNQPVINYKPPIVLQAGDPLADLKLNPSIRPEALVREQKRLGLDKPLWKQYLLWLDGVLVRGDLGLTQQGEPVVQAVKAPLFNTIMLNIFVLLFTWLIGVPLGVLAGVNRENLWDRLILAFSSLSLTTPAFLLTIFILAVAVKVGIGGVGGLTSTHFNDLNPLQKVFDIANHLLLPVSILTFVSLGGLIRQMRGNLLDTLNEDYIKAARARGIPENVIFWRHALQNAINPLVTLLGFEFAALVSGAALTEMILAYPGIGALTLEAARRLDINLIMFNLLLGTVMLMLGNVLADWLLTKVDPRTRR